MNKNPDGTAAAAPVYPTLTEGPISRTLLFFSLPVLGSSVLQSLNASINTIWIGHFLGEAALTASANANSIVFLLLATVIGLVMATGILIGQSVGARDLDQAKRVLGTSTVFFIGLSVLVAVMGLLWANPLMQWMHTPEDALPYAVSYMRIMFLSLPPTFAYNYLMMTLRGAGDSKTPFVFMLISVLLDIALNPLLIFGYGPVPGLGIAGSALATFIAQTVTLVAMVVVLYRRRHFLCIHRHELRYFRLDPQILKALVTRGIPMGMQMMVFTSSMMAMLNLINGFGSQTTAAYGAAMQLWTYVQMPAIAIGSAVTSMAAQNIGAGLWERIPRITRAGLFINLAMTGATVALLYLFNRPAVGLFLPDDGAAIDIAAHMNAVVLWSFILTSITFVLLGVVRATGAVVGPLVVMVVSMWVIRVPLAALLMPRFQANGIWWSFTIGAGASLILSAAYYFWGGWKKVRMLKPA